MAMWCEMKELLTTKQVQTTLMIDRTTVYRMLKDGRLHGVKVGSQWRFQATEINTLLNGSAVTDEQAHQVRSLPYTGPASVACLQAVQDVSAETVGVAAIITDYDGQPISSISNSCAFCNLILSTASGQQACKNTWHALSQQTAVNPEFTTCHAGLQCARAPIEVNDVTTSIVVAGQFYTTMPETAVQQQYIKNLADTHGLSAAALTKSIRDVPIFSPAKQENLINWLQKLANTFSVIEQERAEMFKRFQNIINISNVANSPLIK